MTGMAFHPDADAEVIAAAGWYDQRSPGLGADFLDEFEAALWRIKNSPEAFGIVVRNIRQHMLHRFPYGIVYRIETDRIYVLAVMHLHRDPQYWENRI
jgi:hypothetical protein